MAPASYIYHPVLQWKIKKSVLCCAVLCHCAVPLYCAVVLCRTVVLCAVLYCAVLYCPVPYCAVLYCAVLCRAVPCHAVPYCTVLYCISLWNGRALKLGNCSEVDSIYIPYSFDQILAYYRSSTVVKSS